MEKELSNSDFLKELEKYFKETSKEQVLKDWENTVGYDNSDVTANEFIKLLELREDILKSSIKSNESSEDITIKFVNKLLEFQEGLKTYDSDLSIFGGDITNHSKDYILQNIIINRVGLSKYLSWQLSNKEGIFFLEWFNMSLKDIVIKDLYGRKLDIESKIEFLKEDLEELNKKIKRYGNNI